jgi:hypothetical protein
LVRLGGNWYEPALDRDQGGKLVRSLFGINPAPNDTGDPTAAGGEDHHHPPAGQLLRQQSRAAQAGLLSPGELQPGPEGGDPPGLCRLHLPIRSIDVLQWVRRYDAYWTASDGRETASVRSALAQANGSVRPTRSASLVSCAAVQRVGTAA